MCFRFEREWVILQYPTYNHMISHNKKLNRHFHDIILCNNNYAVIITFTTGKCPIVERRPF